MGEGEVIDISARLLHSCAGTSGLMKREIVMVRSWKVREKEERREKKESTMLF